MVAKNRLYLFASDVFANKSGRHRAMLRYAKFIILMRTQASFTDRYGKSATLA